MTCTKFGTNRLWLDDLRRQRTETATLIETRKTMFREQTGLQMPANNVWLQERVKELAALDAIIARLDDEPRQRLRGRSRSPRTPTHRADPPSRER